MATTQMHFDVRCLSTSEWQAKQHSGLHRHCWLVRCSLHLHSTALHAESIYVNQLLRSRSNTNTACNKATKQGQQQWPHELTAPTIPVMHCRTDVCGATTEPSGGWASSPTQITALLLTRAAPSELPTASQLQPCPAVSAREPSDMPSQDTYAARHAANRKTTAARHTERTPVMHCRTGVCRDQRGGNLVLGPTSATKICSIAGKGSPKRAAHCLTLATLPCGVCQGSTRHTLGNTAKPTSNKFTTSV